MRNLVVYEALNQVAVEAAERLGELVVSGQEIPFEVVEEPGRSSPLYCYRPLTGTFIRERPEVVQGLPSFGAACAALASAGIGADYLKAVDFAPPADPRRASEEAILAFLSRLWEQSTDFSLEGDRFDRAYRELEGATGEGPEATEVIVPLIGLQMPLERLQLGDALTLVRSDTVEAPVDARRPEGQARTPWESQVLASVRCPDEGPDTPAPVTAAQLALRGLITTLRLFKSGGVALGPHAWTRAGEGPWRRLATGAARPRGGGYWLTETDIPELTAFSAAASARPLRGGALAWAIGRFEMGTERRSSLEGLSDHLLALRALLEGGGAGAIGLSMRVAALCAQPEARHAVRTRVERALAIELSMMRGFAAALEDGEESITELVGEIEEHVRAILRDAVVGHLGSDLRATADEILAADGLVSGTEAGAEPVPAGVAAHAAGPEAEGEDWLADAGPHSQHTLEWPVRPPIEPPSDGEVGAGRHLFPVPETTEWAVGELGPRNMGWHRGGSRHALPPATGGEPGPGRFRKPASQRPASAPPAGEPEAEPAAPRRRLFRRALLDWATPSGAAEEPAEDARRTAEVDLDDDAANYSAPI